MPDAKEMYGLILKMRERRPLIHHITNWVTIYDCAQITRAAGALPVMAHAKEEVEEMASLASALVINIGTLTPELIESAILAQKKANEMGIPVVLDAVGAGATRLRTESAVRIMNSGISVLKGNYGEIATLAGSNAEVRGVESMGLEGEIEEIAEKLAVERNFVVAATGKEDIVTDGKRTAKVLNGHELMGAVVGTGCMATSVIGSFLAVSGDVFSGTVYALSAYGIAGEMAARNSKAPMEFKHRLMDSMALISEKDCERMRVIS